MGYVYVAEASKIKRIKIGVTEQNVHQRIAQIQTGCPAPINRVWVSQNIPNALDCERLLHRIFRKDNCSGEWFTTKFFDAVEKADEICNKSYNDLFKENSEMRFENESLKAGLDELKEDIALMKLSMQNIGRLMKKYDF